MEHGEQGAFPFDNLSLFLLSGLYFFCLSSFTILWFSYSCWFIFLHYCYYYLYTLFFVSFWSFSFSSRYRISKFVLVPIFPSSFDSFAPFSACSLQLSCPPSSHCLLPFTLNASFHILFLLFTYLPFYLSDSFAPISACSLQLSCPPSSHCLLPFTLKASFHILFLVFTYLPFSLSVLSLFSFSVSSSHCSLLFIYAFCSRLILM